jgi:exosortase
LAVARHQSANQHRRVTGSEAPHRLPIPARVNLAALAILAGALVVHLWPEWTHDPDLSHGILMPVICAALLYLGRRPAPRDTLARGTAVLLAAGFGAAALAGLWLAGLFAVTLDWTSPVVDFTLTCAFALLGGAALAAFSDRRVSLVAFNWTTFCAAALWPLCAPFPPGTYARLTLALQLWVSGSVMRTLDLLGVAAHRQGNIIELSRGTVGIEEACSGVRSLVSCVFAGILLSAVVTRRPWARAVVIALSAPLALAMNYLRSLLLTLLVNGGVRVEGALHDATGFAVLLATAAILFGVAAVLDKGDARAAHASEGRAGPGVPGAPLSTGILGIVLLLGGATLAVFVTDTTATPPTGKPAPDLVSMLPVSAAGWQVEDTPDLFQFAGILRTDHLAQRTYRRKDAAGVEQVTIYLAYWSEGQASVGLVGSHTPDACWPGAGWVPTPVPDPVVALDVGGSTLAAAQHRLFVDEGYPQQVWYWQLYEGRPVDVGNPKSVRALVRIALRYGFRKSGSQAFVRISSNRSWVEISREPFVVEFVERARALGLY